MHENEGASGSCRLLLAGAPPTLDCGLQISSNQVRRPFPRAVPGLRARTQVVRVPKGAFSQSGQEVVLGVFWEGGVKGQVELSSNIYCGHQRHERMTRARQL